MKTTFANRYFGFEALQPSEWSIGFRVRCFWSLKPRGMKWRRTAYIDIYKRCFYIKLWTVGFKPLEESPEEFAEKFRGD